MRATRWALSGVATVSALLNGTLWGVALFVFDRSAPAAILHYRTDIGIDFIGEGKHIVALPLIGSIILGFNFVLGTALWQTDRLATWLLWGVVPLLQALLLIGFYFLWRANT